MKKIIGYAVMCYVPVLLFAADVTVDKFQIMNMRAELDGISDSMPLMQSSGEYVDFHVEPILTKSDLETWKNIKQEIHLLANSMESDFRQNMQAKEVTVLVNKIDHTVGELSALQNQATVNKKHLKQYISTLKSYQKQTISLRKKWKRETHIQNNEQMKEALYTLEHFLNKIERALTKKLS